MRGNNKGISGALIGGLITLIMAGFVLAFFRANNIKSVHDVIRWARGETPKVSKCANGGDCEINLKVKDPMIGHQHNSKPLTDNAIGYKGPQKGQPFLDDSIKYTKKTFVDSVNGLQQATQNAIKKAEKEKFKKSDWPHFVPSGRDCWSTENEILSNQAIAGTVKYRDEYRQKTDDKNKACSITDGKWIDTYTGKEVKRGDIVLDYAIPLEYAHSHGGLNWDAKKKQQFANDADNIVVTSSSQSKDRDGKSPSKWLPKNKNSKCVIAKKQINVLSKYSLTIDEKDKSALLGAVQACDK